MPRLHRLRRAKWCKFDWCPGFHAFAEAFRSPPNIIARPFVVTYRWNVCARMTLAKRLKASLALEQEQKRGPHPTFEELNKVGLESASTSQMVRRGDPGLRHRDNLPND